MMKDLEKMTGMTNETVDGKPEEAAAAGELTRLVFIIDRSGSMSGLERDTVGGFNTVLANNRELPGDCRVTTLLFSTEHELLHDDVPLEKVRDMTLRDYRPSGCTALLDAMGTAITRMLWKEEKSRVQFVIITDGEENASSEYSLDKIRSMVTRMTEERGWDFIFLGANMDAISTAAGMGIRPGRAVDAFADARGTQVQYEAISSVNLMFRSSPRRCMESTEWRKPIEADAARRKSGKE